MPAPPIKSSRERKPSSSHEAGQVSFLMPQAPGLPGPFFSKRACSPPSGWSFLDTQTRTVTVHRLTATPKPRASTKRCTKSSCPNQSHAEREPHQDPAPWAIGGCGLNVSAEASTRTPQLHQPHLLWEPSSSHKELSPALAIRLEWLSIFGRGFRLRCFQPLSPIAWLPGSALSNNR